MKSLMLYPIAAALVVPAMAAPALAAENHPNNHGRQVSQAAHAQTGQHQFKRGEKFDRSRASNYREVDYRTDKRFKAPPRGYHWVRSGHDALLVRTNTGLISSVIGGIFR